MVCWVTSALVNFSGGRSHTPSELGWLWLDRESHMFPDCFPAGLWVFTPSAISSDDRIRCRYKLMIVFWIVLVYSSQSVKTRPEVKTEVNLHGRQPNIVIVKAEELLRLYRCGIRYDCPCRCPVRWHVTESNPQHPWAEPMDFLRRQEAARAVHRQAASWAGDLQTLRATIVDGNEESSWILINPPFPF